MSDESPQQVCSRALRTYVTMDPDDVQDQKKYIRDLLDFIKEKLIDDDDLFDHLFKDFSNAGSFYEGLKVSKPNEYDILINFTFPEIDMNQLEMSTENCKAGSMSIRGLSSVLNAMPKSYMKRTLEKWCNENDYLLPAKLRNWFQGRIDSFLYHHGEEFKDEFELYDVRAKQSGPATTLKLLRVNGDKIDIDLVPFLPFKNLNPPCPIKTLPFPEISWGVVPKGISKKKNNKKSLRNHYEDDFVDFFENSSYIVEDQLREQHRNNNRNQLLMEQNAIEWRLSFNFHEKKLIHDKDHLKPAIRMMKRLRDVRTWNLTSYHLKTVALWALDKHDWDSLNLYETFIILLENLKTSIDQNHLSYYWDPRQNFMKSFKMETRINMKNALRNLIEKFKDDPTEIEKVLEGRDQEDIIHKMRFQLMGMGIVPTW